MIFDLEYAYAACHKRLGSLGADAAHQAWIYAQSGKDAPIAVLHACIKIKRQAREVTVSGKFPVLAAKNQDKWIGDFVTTLTDRQAAIARGLSEARELGEIGQELGVSRDTLTREVKIIRERLAEYRAS